LANAGVEVGSDPVRGAGSRPRGPADLAAVLLWTAALAAFFWDAVTFRKALFYFDISEINYPYRDFLAGEMRLGRFSRWFPGLYCGLPLFSESQAGYFHPLKFLLYPWLPTWKALNLDTVLSVWLTGLGTYGWLRRHVGAAGALTGAAVFGLGGFVWAHLIHTSMTNALTSVPFVLWATEWAWDRGRAAGVALGAAALAFQVFAGHLQDTLLTAGLLGAYAAFRAFTAPTWRDGVRTLTVASAVVGLGVALAAVQWVPSKELLDRSPRAGGLGWWEQTYGSWHPELLPTLVVREAYGTRARDTDWMDGFYPYHEMNAYLGLLALALAVVGGAAARDRWVAFWVALAALSFTLMMGRYTFLFDYMNRLPVVGSSRIPVRFHLWFSTAVAALAAVGVDRLGRGLVASLRPAFVTAGVLAALAAPIAVAVYAPVWTEPGRWTSPYHEARYRWLGRELAWGTARTALIFGLGAGAMTLAARGGGTPRRRAAAAWGLPVLVIADLLGAHARDVPTVDPSYWTDPPPTALAVLADPTHGRVFGVADKSSGEPGYASEPVDFFAARDALDWSLPPVWGLNSSGGETPLIPRRVVGYTDHVRPGQGRFDLENVTHIVVGGRRTSASTSASVGGRGHVIGAATVIPNPSALPRARLMGRPVYADDERAAADALDRLGPEVRDRLVVEDPTRPLPEGAAASGSARIGRDDPEHVEVTTDAVTPAYLVLADTYDPGWSAAIDGRPAPIRPAYLTFRAVYLTAGRHRVVFRYRPAGFRLGLGVSLAGLAIALPLLLWPRRLPDCGPGEGPLPWPAHWPRRVWVAAAAVVLASAVGLDRDGRPHLHSRWSNSFHRHTWGAGLEAMRQKPGG